MPVFGARSKQCLSEAHPLLQIVMNEAIKKYDFSVICGYRGKEAQEEAFREGHSNARFGQSPHNFKPSFAVDIVPYPLDWNDIAAFNRMGQHVMSVASRLDVKLKWGRDFSFKDYPHFELLDWKRLK